MESTGILENGRPTKTSREELAQSNKIIVYAVRNRLPESVDDIPKIIELISKNKDNIYFKTPLLK